MKQLQLLLDSLKGSPVGLKLNIELNNFFLGCFRYHIDLWATFLVIVAPLIKYIIAPLAVFGCLGLSFQLAILSDLLSIITLHAHCIYIYAAMFVPMPPPSVGDLVDFLIFQFADYIESKSSACSPCGESFPADGKTF